MAAKIEQHGAPAPSEAVERAALKVEALAHAKEKRKARGNAKLKFMNPGQRAQREKKKQTYLERKRSREERATAKRGKGGKGGGRGDKGGATDGDTADRPRKRPRTG